MIRRALRIAGLVVLSVVLIVTGMVLEAWLDSVSKPAHKVHKNLFIERA